MVLATAPKAIVLLVKFVIIIVQVTQGYHAFALVFVDFHVDAIFRDAGDGAVVLLTQVVLQVFDLLVLDARALGLGSQLLHLAGMVAEVLVLRLHGAASALGIAGQKAVDHHVGIAADGRGEVGVEVESQAIVTDVDGAVLGFHHGAQSDGFHHVLLRLLFHFGQ